LNLFKRSVTYFFKASEGSICLKVTEICIIASQRVGLAENPGHQGA
jgi:hypothetical protein